MSPEIEKTEENSAVEEFSSSPTAIVVAPDPKALEWEEARFRVRAYLNYWGIRDEESLQRITLDVLERVHAKDEAYPVEDLPKCAVEEALAIVDSNLAGCIDSHSSVASTIAPPETFPVWSPRIGLMFCKSVEDYPHSLFQIRQAPDSMTGPILSSVRWVQGVCSVPAHHAVPMEPQKLMFYRPIVGLRRFFFWLIGSFLRYLGKLFTADKKPD